MDNTLETVFSTAHPWHNRYYYDKAEGAYYDRHTDFYLSYSDWCAVLEQSRHFCSN